MHKRHTFLGKKHSAPHLVYLVCVRRWFIPRARHKQDPRFCVKLLPGSERGALVTRAALDVKMPTLSLWISDACSNRCRAPICAREQGSDATCRSRLGENNARPHLFSENRIAERIKQYQTIATLPDRTNRCIALL